MRRIAVPVFLALGIGLPATLISSVALVSMLSGPSACDKAPGPAPDAMIASDLDDIWAAEKVEPAWWLLEKARQAARDGQHTEAIGLSWEAQDAGAGPEASRIAADSFAKLGHSRAALEHYESWLEQTGGNSHGAAAIKARVERLRQGNMVATHQGVMAQYNALIHMAHLAAKQGDNPRTVALASRAARLFPGGEADLILAHSYEAMHGGQEAAIRHYELWLQYRNVSPLTLAVQERVIKLRAGL